MPEQIRSAIQSKWWIPTVFALGLALRLAGFSGGANVVLWSPYSRRSHRVRGVSVRFLARRERR